MTADKPEILVIDDEQRQLDTMCRGLLLCGYACQGVLGKEAAIEALNNDDDQRYDLVLMDLTEPNMAGIELVERLKRDWPSLPIVIITGLANKAWSKLVLSGNIAYLKKPFDPDTLDSIIQHSLKRRFHS